MEKIAKHESSHQYCRLPFLPLFLPLSSLQGMAPVDAMLEYRMVLNSLCKPRVVAHTYNANTWETESGGFSINSSYPCYNEFQTSIG